MTTKQPLSNVSVHVKFKLSALWVAVMFCYVYGDFFSLFVPGRLQGMMAGESGVGATTPINLLLFALMMTLPALMIFVSLVLRPALNRVVNLIVGSLFTAIILLTVVTAISEWRLFYTFLGCIEILLTSLIVGYAARWPREAETV